MTDEAVDRLLVVGTNHRTGALSLRDALAVEDGAMPAALADLRARGLGEAVLLSTCDRVEIIATTDDRAAATGQILAFLADRADRPVEEVQGQLYVLTGEEAVRHLFAVASSLDSLMIGEPHVLGQVKAAHRMSRDAALNGHDLDVCLQAAYAVAKRVRSETSIAEGPVSVASSAVQTARDLFGDLRRCRILLAGGGDMGGLITEALQAAGVGRTSVTARRPSRAEVLGRTFSAALVPFEELSAALAETEVVITAIGGGTPAVTEEAVKAALKKRRQRPILFVDAGVPGDVEPAVDRIDNAFLYDLEDLEHVAEQGRSQREAAARAAWEIVTAETEAFLRTRAERAAVPAIAALHRHFEAERARALAEAPQDADKATRLLIGRLLHAPSQVLRDLAADTGRKMSAEDLLRLMFRLDGDKD